MLAIVGVGMALPYLVLAFFPRALNKIPRAGRWSELLKQGLGIVMLGVAIYLVTLVPSTRLWPWVLAGTVVVALVCWGWGQIPTPLMSESRIWTIRAVVLVVGVALGFGIYRIASMTRPATVMSQSGMVLLPDKTERGDAWLPFNLALLDQALKDGRPVLVDWTADWCINCRVLEATVLSREELRRAVVDRNVVLLRADLSQENPPATALNEKLGSQSIPVLAIFAPSRPTEPVVLRDTYSPSRVIQEIAHAR
jgi:thiol:disulfide interchange protein DsbD